MKLPGLGYFFFGRLLIMSSISSTVKGLFQWPISDWVSCESLRKGYVLRSCLTLRLTLVRVVACVEVFGVCGVCGDIGPVLSLLLVICVFSSSFSQSSRVLFMLLTLQTASSLFHWFFFIVFPFPISLVSAFLSYLLPLLCFPWVLSASPPLFLLQGQSWGH